jgi:hypothetical protein
MLTSICIHTYSAQGGARSYRAYSSIIPQRMPEELLRDSLAQVGLPIEQPQEDNMTPYGRLEETHIRRTPIPLQERANGVWIFVDQNGTVIRNAPILSAGQRQEAIQYAEQHQDNYVVFTIHDWSPPV